VWYLDTGAEYPDNAPRVLNTGVWYTGASFVAGESKRITSVTTYTYQPLIDPFDAIVPDVPTLEFADLLQLAADFVANPQAGLAYLAQLLTENPQYADKLRVGRWLGIYNPATIYFRGNVVSYGSPTAAWVWKLESAGSGVAPPSSGTTGNANWDYFPGINVSAPAVDLTNYLLKAGGTMTGNLLLPAPGGSPPATIAVRKQEADAQYVQLANVAQTIAGVKSFSASPLVPTLASNDASTKAANSQYVRDYWNASRYDKILVSAARGASQSLTFNVMNKITWDQIFVNVDEGSGVYLDGAGVFTIRTAGWHRITVGVEYNNTTGSQAGGILRLQRTSAPTASFKLAQAANTLGAAPATVILNGVCLINFAAAEQFEIQFQPQTGSGTHTIVADVNTTRIFVFRQMV